ncbi:uncharacterized protein LOC122060658 [Macadamia integrifolia]|uniref:uncharacterized protein LOC122060658 n=1 Tax=Macadamia integrifolia TaxID=60698 RepID=UPI001C530887|nr:uncharacterized protein LOC122060658 [Macadamia integrifolia]
MHLSHGRGGGRGQSPRHPEPSDPFVDEVLEVDDTVEDTATLIWSNTLVGYILPGKPFRKQAVMEALPTAWNTLAPIEISPIDLNRYLFHFQHPTDLDNVLEEGPWAVNGNLLMLERWKDNGGWLFQFTELWVQFHDVPLDLFSLEFSFQLATMIGTPRKSMAIQGTQFGARVQYLRCRIQIDIHNPLRQIILSKRRSDAKMEIKVKYERLPIFCYRCCLIGHRDSRCPEIFTMQRNQSGEPSSARAVERLGPNIRGSVPDK